MENARRQGDKIRKKMKKIAKLVMFLMMFTMPVLANDIYVTQSGATLTLVIAGGVPTTLTVAVAKSVFAIRRLNSS